MIDLRLEALKPARHCGVARRDKAGQPFNRHRRTDDAGVYIRIERAEGDCVNRTDAPERCNGEIGLRPCGRNLSRQVEAEVRGRDRSSDSDLFEPDIERLNRLLVAEAVA